MMADDGTGLEPLYDGVLDSDHWDGHLCRIAAGV